MSILSLKLAIKKKKPITNIIFHGNKKYILYQNVKLIFLEQNKKSLFPNKINSIFKKKYVLEFYWEFQKMWFWDGHSVSISAKMYSQ